MNSNPDTIAAIATAPGEAGIAVIRISGPDSLSIADRVCRTSGSPPATRRAGSFLRGFVRGDGDGRGAEGADLDEVVVLIFRAPHSYTREDVVEIQCHGGRTSAQRVLGRVLAAGARAAEAGEFTKRAFLSGRIDLMQAEAVADLVRARSDRAAAAAIEQLEGRLSDCVGSVYTSMMEAAADLEVSLDFPEEELPETLLADIVARLTSVAGAMQELLATWQEGRLLREGARVVIAGKPNVGKSTLLNRLLGTNRAIVTDVPGTTRDTIEEQMVIGGIPVCLIDTAGLRESECHIEQQGVSRARASVRGADLVLYMVDGSVPLDAQDAEATSVLDRDRALLILNKTDLGSVVGSGDLPGQRSISVSLLDEGSVPVIREAILTALGVIETAEPHAAISERHKQCVQNALTALNSSMDLLSGGDNSSIILAASTLRVSLEHMGSVTGRIFSSDLLDSIFSRFCIGK